MQRHVSSVVTGWMVWMKLVSILYVILLWIIDLSNTLARSLVSFSFVFGLLSTTLRKIMLLIGLSTGKSWSVWPISKTD